MRAGVQVIVDALEKRLPDETAQRDRVRPSGSARLRSLAARAGRAAAGAPGPKAARRWGARSPQLNLRAITGATVLAIVRQGHGLVPTADDALAVGDVLALAGTHEALDSARQILAAPRLALPTEKAPGADRDSRLYAMFSTGEHRVGPTRRVRFPTGQSLISTGNSLESSRTRHVAGSCATPKRYDSPAKS